MIVYKRAYSKEELKQILKLQKRNMPHALSPSEVQNDGFVTVSHTYDILKKMNDACPHIIAMDGNLVIGYALVMTKEFRDKISILSAMFETAEELLGNKKYVAMGQICISKAYRRQGIFKGMYYFYNKELRKDFDCLITEVATHNTRSLGAHLNLGFKILKTKVSEGISWELICWDWSKSK